MSEDEKVSIEFVSRQLDRVLTRFGAIEDQLTVLTGIYERYSQLFTGECEPCQPTK